METWEFLLQKQGTRSWLPLQTRKVSVGAGIYRLVAQGCPPRIDVEIQVFYQTLDATYPERRSQKRVGRTSEEGLMVIVPFTDLRPGLWELHISSPQIRALWGDDWQDVVQMKVKPPKVTSPQVSPAEETPQNGSHTNGNGTGQQRQASDSVIPTPQRVAAYQPTFSLNQSGTPQPAAMPPEPVAVVAPPEPESGSVQAWLASLPPLALVNPASGVVSEPAPAPEAPMTALERSESESELGSETDFASQLTADWAASDDAVTEATTTPALTPEVLTTHAVGVEPTPAIPESAPPAQPLPPELADTPHALLEQSIQSLEQMLQQVSEPGERSAPPPASASMTVEAPLKPTPTPPTPAPSTPTELPEPAFLTTATLTAEPAHEAAFASVAAEPIAAASLPRLKISLAQDTFIRHHDEPILISGQVELRDSLESTVLDHGFAGFLHYELRDPQTQELLLAVEQPLHDATIPLVFNYLLDVPTAYATRLVLGEVRLTITQPAIAALDEEEEGPTLAQQTFSITAGLADLLQTVREAPTSQHQPEPPRVLKVPTTSGQPPQQASPLSQAQPTILPPKLPQINSTGRKLPELPSFGNPPPSAQTSPNRSFLPSMGSEQPADPEPFALGSEHSPLESSMTHPADTDPVDVERDELMATLAARVDGVSEQHRSQNLVNSNQTGTPNQAGSPALPLPLSQGESEPPLSPAEQRPDWQGLPDELHQLLTVEQLVEPRSNLAPRPSPTPPIPNLAPLALEHPESRSAPSFNNGAASSEPDQFSQDQTDSELETASSTAQSLQLDVHFSQQLSRLAVGGSALPEPNDTTASHKRPELSTAAPEQLSDWPMQEFVVEDEPPESNQNPSQHPNPSVAPPLPTYDASGLPYPSQLQAATAWLSPTNPPPQPSALSKTPAPSPMTSAQPTPPPTPELRLPNGELVAGDLVLVKVTIPKQSGLVYVKLWVKDCETRQLLDGPRAFVDFETLPTGQLETMTQVIVPLGSLAIRFEAITIDVGTGQESHKVSCDRPVVPPDFTQLNIDGFSDGITGSLSALPFPEH